MAGHLLINLETNVISSDATGVERTNQAEQESENSSLVVRFQLLSALQYTTKQIKLL